MAENCPILTLNDDDLHLIFAHCNLKERLVAQKVCKKWRNILNRWNDVKSIAVSDDFFVTNNGKIDAILERTSANNVLRRIEPFIVKLLEKCCHVTTLVIHNPNILDYYPQTWDMFKNLEVLVLPNSAFDIDNRPYSCHRNISQLFLNNTKLSNLSILNDKLMIRKKTALFLPCHIQSLSTKNLNVLQIQGLIMGPKSMEMLSRKYGETVSELRIGGVCVHTSEKNQYWSSIEKMKNIRVLELPPSLFSLTRPIQMDFVSPLKSLPKLKSLSVYVCRCGHEEMNLFLGNIPKTIEKLSIRDATGKFGHDYAFFSSKNIKIRQLPKGNVGFYFPSHRPISKSRLSIRAFWDPPYFRQIELLNMNLNPQIIAAQISNWECVIPEILSLEIETPTFTAVDKTEIVTARLLSEISNVETARPPTTSSIPDQPDEMGRELDNFLDRINMAIRDFEEIQFDPVFQEARPRRRRAPDGPRFFDNAIVRNDLPNVPVIPPVPNPNPGINLAVEVVAIQEIHDDVQTARRPSPVTTARETTPRQHTLRAVELELYTARSEPSSSYTTVDSPSTTSTTRSIASSPVSTTTSSGSSVGTGWHM